METIKSLVLGSAAGLLAIGGVQAADLPMKAKAVEYVRVCSLYGAGFFYIPGTDTCIKLGGFVRIDTTFNGGIFDQPLWNGDGGQGNRYRNYFATRSRLALTVDTRTATEYGVVRTFGQGNFNFDTLGNTTANPTALAVPNTPNLLSTNGGGYLTVDYVFIQFAGFTFGKSSSAYATPWNGSPGNNTSFLIGGHDSITGVNNIQYTMQFGNGVSGTIGLDDPTVGNRTSIYNLSTGLSAVGVTGNAYGGTMAPDIVGNIKVDQAWGLFQLSGALHQVNASYNNLTATTAAPNNLSMISGNPASKWGGSVMAALQIKNIPTGVGDDIKIDASYAIGDTKNVISTAGASPSFAMFGNGGAAAFRSVAFGATTDAVYLPVAAGGTGDLKLTTAFGVRGAYNHNWDPYWSTSLFGGVGWVRYGGNANDITSAKGQYCATFFKANGVANKATSTCDPNFMVSELGVITRWTPVKNLTFSAEAMWTHLTTGFTGTAVLTPTAPAPTATYQFKNQDTVSFNVRAQRNF
jgi:porin-like protein